MWELACAGSGSHMADPASLRVIGVFKSTNIPKLTGTNWMNDPKTLFTSGMNLTREVTDFGIRNLDPFLYFVM